LGAGQKICRRLAITLDYVRKAMAPLLYTNHLRALARSHRSKVALIEGEERHSYAELWASIVAAASGLEREGIGQGDIVATAMSTTVPHLAVILAALHCGATVSPLNTRLSVAELKPYVDRQSPVVIVADDTHADLASGLGATLTLAGSEAVGPLRQRLGPLWGATEDSECQAEENQPAMILPTGGTTGAPKGVVLSHRALLLRSTMFGLEGERDLYDVQINMTPFFHATIYAGPLATLAAGATVDLHSRFDPGAAVASIERGANNLAGLATMLQAIRRHERFASIDRSGVRRVGWGAMPGSAELVGALAEDYPNASLQHTYGSSETGFITRLHNTDIKAGRFTGVGRARPGVTIRVLDDDMTAVRPGEVGELYMSTPYEASYYWGMPEETAYAFTPLGIRLGDLGWVSDDGWVTLVGRRSEMILSGGEHVFPKEVEDVFGSHPDVLEIAVYGMADPDWGERVEAAVVLRPGSAPSRHELLDFGRQSLGGFKLPKVVRLIESIPVTSNSKVDRRALTDIAARLPELS
jgi:fatty-acyl-CoA synthase